MGNDYRTEPVFRTAMIHQEAGRDHADGRRRHLPAHAYEDPTKKPAYAPADAASVLGLPADHVTPEILAALTPLLAELERLRWSSEQALRRLDWLEKQSDRHSVAPCLTRRAFMRELDSFMTGQGRGMICVVQTAGIEALRQLHGLPAGEGALRHVCANIIGALRSTDLVGCLGGSDFAVLMPGSDRGHARAKLDEILAHMKDQPYMWLGQRIPLTTAWGLHDIAAGEGAEQAVAAADRNRRGME